MLAAALSLAALHAAEHRGRVTYGGEPVPGVSVIASRGGDRQYALTGADGRYVFPDLPGGPWTLRVEMQLFEVQNREVSVAANAPELVWELRLTEAADLARLAAPASAQTRFAPVAVRPAAQPPKPAAEAKPPGPAAAEELQQRAADGFLVNGSVNNPAASVFAQLPAFGNFRRGQRSLYNGIVGLLLNSSALDARPYSLTGQHTPKPAYRRVEGLFAFGGPLKIPGWIRRNGPVVSLNYQWTRSSNARTQSALLASARELAGDFSFLAQPLKDPSTLAPLSGNRIPAARLSPQALALARLFPAPNFTGDSRYNYQAALVSAQHQDDLQTRVNKQVRRNFFAGNFAWQSVRTSSTDVFNLLDTGRVRGLAAGANYRRNFSPRFLANVGLQFNRLTTRSTPFFSNRENVSAAAGISGNNQEPVNWGPPALQFTSGYASLAPAQASRRSDQTASLETGAFLIRDGHYLTLGYNHRRQQFNVLAQQEARGAFTFTGLAAGHDLAGFLFGVPDASSIAYGNADKYLRAQIHEAFLNDDYRVNPSLTLNVGLRWEYWSPAREKYGRLVNLRIAEGFRDASPIVERDGAKQGTDALFPRPDRNNFSPRLAFAWRPRPATPLVVRGGYGVYFDTSVYAPLALRMAQQAPLNKSLRLSNSPGAPLTLAAGFPDTAAASVPTFAVDPGFRTGFLHMWQFSVQGDLPWAMQATATYSGSRAARAQQQTLPNTFPLGAVQPAGFTYLTSNGGASRTAAEFQLRRRLRSGFTASAAYTLSKAMDNAAPGGRNPGIPFIAQNWLDLRAERGRSTFDQRHLFNGMVQYTAGMGMRGGALASGRAAALGKEWTLGMQITAGSGLPLTPLLPGIVPGTGVAGVLRPDSTGAPLYSAPAGRQLNPAAYAAPPPGRWGNAARNSIEGPGQLRVNGSLGRTFRSSERVSLDFRLEAVNLLNQVTFPSWNTVFGSAQFGLPATANPMRTLQAALRMRF